MENKEFILAIDIGNTRVKFAIMQDRKIIKLEAIPSKPTVTLENLYNIFNSIISSKTFKAVLISSVVPYNSNVVKNFLKDKLLCKITFIERGINLIAKEKYGSGRAGIDIICKSAYLASKKQDALCIDSGTATVINYISKEGFLESVAITLGFRAMYNALHNEAALLPLYNPNKADKLLNNNTELAINGGNYFGYIGLLNELVETAKKETGCKKVYFTGGYSFLFKDVVQFNHIYDPFLLFRGMYLIYSKNKGFFNNQ